MLKNTFLGGNMKRCVFVCITMVTVILFSCSNDHAVDYELLEENGAINVSISLGETGALQKIMHMNSSIEIEKICISLTAEDQSNILDTITLNGESREITEEKTYSMVAWTENEAVEWTLSVESQDKQGTVIHSGDTVFTPEPEDTINISMELTAQHSDVISDSLLLWNKLGSQYEVEHSEVGPNGFFDNQEGELTFEQFYHGNGVRYPFLEELSKNTCKIAFDFSEYDFTTEQGCVEFWWKAGYTDNDMNPNDEGVDPTGFRVFFSTADTTGHPPGPPHSIESGFLYMYNDNWVPERPDMNFLIGVPDTTLSSYAYAVTSQTYQGFTEDDAVHWACTFDVHGIDNSDTTAILYKNGNPIAVSKLTWTPYNVGAFWIGNAYTASWDPTEMIRELAYNPAHGVYDNIKIWNYAKTDFSDRFEE